MKLKIAILDDYQQVAETFADWRSIQAIADVTFFHHNDADLRPFDILCVMRERTPISSDLLNNLPNLKLIVSTGMRNFSIDTETAAKRGITVKYTRYLETGAPELTWTLIMALARNITTEAANFKAGNWQTTIGQDLAGKTIGLIGLGRVGTKIAKIARAFEMNVIAWSQNLTEEKANAAGAELVSKAQLFKAADFVSVHLVLSERTRGIIGLPSLQQMKPTAYLVNTSRGPLIDESALIKVLQDKTIAGAALDVYDVEPLPKDHPFRSLENLLATSHIGYVTENTYKLFYGDTVQVIKEWLDTRQV